MCLSHGGFFWGLPLKCGGTQDATHTRGWSKPPSRVITESPPLPATKGRSDCELQGPPLDASI